MSFSYSGDPANSTVDATRFLIGDTNEDTAEFQDEELQYLLTGAGSSPIRAAIEALEQLANKYARMPSYSMEGASVQYGELSQKFRDRAYDLKQRLATGATIGYTPRVDAFGAETQPIFSIGMHDNPASDEADRYTS